MIRNSHLNMIRKITWSFHRTTGFDWDELFADAMLGYYDGLYQLPKKPHPAKKTTWIYKCVTTRLVWFLDKEAKNNHISIEANNWIDYPVVQIPFFELFDSLSSDSKEIAQMILDNPYPYLRSKRTRELVCINLRKHKHWKWHRIWDGMRNIKLELSKTR